LKGATWPSQPVAIDSTRTGLDPGITQRNGSSGWTLSERKHLAVALDLVSRFGWISGIRERRKVNELMNAVT